MWNHLACVLLISVVSTQAQMEGFIVGSSHAIVKDYPHAAFLTMTCSVKHLKAWRCGASILNQFVLITAAHCVEPCMNKKMHVTINIGNEHREKGLMRSASGMIVHNNFEPDTLACDIALIKMSKPLKFSARISRVAIMRKPPYRESASLAAWGLINETTKEQGLFLKKLDQEVKKHSACAEMFGELLPRGTLCAETDDEDNYLSSGDSGAGLVVRGYIQIGIASFKLPKLHKNVMIYTDVGYFYEWIDYNAARLICTLD